jgi:hypothetical protein
MRKRKRYARAFGAEAASGAEDASGTDGHLGSGRDASGGMHRARNDLSAAVLVILVASLVVFGWRTFEDTLISFFDSICCGQVIAFPAIDTGLTPQVLEEGGGSRGMARFLPFLSRENDYAYLAEWPERRRERLRVWLDLGVRFEGEWGSEELAVTLDVLDAYGSVYGDERFAEIAQRAIRSRSGGWRNYLTVTRVPGTMLPAAAWAPGAGRILLNDGLFDDSYFVQFYNWSFMAGDHAENDGAVDMLAIVIAHEFGHVLIDGLRLEATPEGGSELSMEELYTRHVPPEQWPHRLSSANENLATEVGIWALGVTRTAEINLFRANVLKQTALDGQWSDRVVELTPLPPSSR